MGRSENGRDRWNRENEREGRRLRSGEWWSENGHHRWNRENEREERRLGSGEWRPENGSHQWNHENEREGRRLGSGEWRSENGRYRWNREYERAGQRLGFGKRWSENRRGGRWESQHEMSDAVILVIGGQKTIVMINGSINQWSDGEAKELDVPESHSWIVFEGSDL